MQLPFDSSSNCFPSPRPEIVDLSSYTAPLEGRRDLLRLDFNENTLGPSPLVIRALKDIHAEHIAIYPEYGGLREAFVKNLTSLGLSAPLSVDQVGLFNGVDAAIHAIFHAYGDKDTLLLTTSPTFGYYTPCARMQGMKISAIPYIGSDFSFPFDAIYSELVSKQPRLLFICNPNNPTGTRLSPQSIIHLAHAEPKTLVVVDELYEAFTGDSVMPLVDFEHTPNLLVLRSLSKTAGLAGLRIGFAIGDPRVVDMISRVTGPYDINSLAVTAAFAALSDQAYVETYVNKVFESREWIKAKLEASDLRFHLDGGNYFLIWPRREPLTVESALRSDGILVRNMLGKHLLEGALRVSIGTIDQMKKFWDSFSSIDAN